MAYTIRSLNYDFVSGIANLSIAEPPANDAPGAWSQANVTLQLHPPVPGSGPGVADEAKIKAAAKAILLAAASVL